MLALLSLILRTLSRMSSPSSCPCSHPAVHIAIANTERTHVAEVQAALTRLSTTISDNHQRTTQNLSRLAARLENPDTTTESASLPPQPLPIPPLNSIRQYLRHLDHGDYTTDRILTHYQDNISFTDYNVDGTTAALERMEQNIVQLMMTTEARLHIAGYSYAAHGLRRPRAFSLPTVLDYDACIPRPTLYGITRTRRP